MRNDIFLYFTIDLDRFDVGTWSKNHYNLKVNYEELADEATPSYLDCLF
jgi:hypothetical protein